MRPGRVLGFSPQSNQPRQTISIWRLALPVCTGWGWEKPGGRTKCLPRGCFYCRQQTPESKHSETCS